MARSAAPVQFIPLTELEIRQLSELIRLEIAVTLGARRMRWLKVILEKLDHAALTSP